MTDGKGSRLVRLLKTKGWRDEELIAEFGAADAENLSYDFFKSLTSLSLLTLGGVLTLSESVFAAQVETWQMLTAALLVSAAGIISLQCQADIVQISRGAKTYAPWLKIGHRVAAGLLGAGVGAYLIILTGALG